MITEIQYWKTSDTSTTLYFALYNEAGSRIAYTNASASTGPYGLKEVAWVNPYTFTVNQKFWLGHSGTAGVAYSNLIYGQSWNANTIPTVKSIDTFFSVTTNGVWGGTGPLNIPTIDPTQ